MARCLEKGKQVPRSSLPIRPLCISLNIVFINKAEQRKHWDIKDKTNTEGCTIFHASTRGLCCARTGVGRGEELLRKVQQPC